MLHKILGFAVVIAGLAYTDTEAFCRRCEEIREHNEKYHENFEYYQDYLISLEEKNCEEEFEEEVVDAKSEEPHLP